MVLPIPTSVNPGAILRFAIAGCAAVPNSVDRGASLRFVSAELCRKGSIVGPARDLNGSTRFETGVKSRIVDHTHCTAASCANDLV